MYDTTYPWLEELDGPTADELEAIEREAKALVSVHDKF